MYAGALFCRERAYPFERFHGVARVQGISFGHGAVDSPDRGAWLVDAEYAAAHVTAGMPVIKLEIDLVAEILGDGHGFRGEVLLDERKQEIIFLPFFPDKEKAFACLRHSAKARVEHILGHAISRLVQDTSRFYQFSRFHDPCHVLHHEPFRLDKGNDPREANCQVASAIILVTFARR